MAVQSNVRKKQPVDSQPHGMESGVRREILSAADVSVASLVVRRVPDGVCLEGVVRIRNDRSDVNALVKRILEVEDIGEVHNHLLVCSDDD